MRCVRKNKVKAANSQVFGQINEVNGGDHFNEVKMSWGGQIWGGKSSLFLRYLLALRSHKVNAVDWIVTAPPPVRMLKLPPPQCGGIWRWGLWEAMEFGWVITWGPQDRISALLRRDTRDHGAVCPPREEQREGGWSLGKNLTLLAAGPQISSFQNCGKSMSAV